jgi:hypothetical protein
MALDEERLRIAARRRYERARLVSALRGSWYVVPLAVVSLAGCGRPAATIAVGVGLLALVTYLGWRGQAHRRAIAPGVLGGVVPLIVPPAINLTGHPCLGGICLAATAACLVGGFVGALIVGLHSARLRQPLPSLALSLLVAALVGSLGCVLAGLTGVLGMAAGFVVAAGPVYWVTSFKRA